MIDDDSAVAGGSEPAVPAGPRTPYSERPVARAGGGLYGEWQQADRNYENLGVWNVEGLLWSCLGQPRIGTAGRMEHGKHQTSWRSSSETTEDRNTAIMVASDYKPSSRSSSG
ncbi:hypothetical protein AB0D59_46800 [Streptomyces sp. NPDC048417]|uniref:hypothetical protein n=1 Tax=Streptomyces sp. NPDC048417 TaxID=3155387 RepID=UPI00344268DE